MKNISKIFFCFSFLWIGVCLNAQEERLIYSGGMAPDFKEIRSMESPMSPSTLGKQNVAGVYLSIMFDKVDYFVVIKLGSASLSSIMINNQELKQYKLICSDATPYTCEFYYKLDSRSIESLTLKYNGVQYVYNDIQFLNRVRNQMKNLPTR